MLPLTLILALLASSASARFMPVHRLASLEGMAVDSDGESSVRPPRHALAFAAFDRPLSPDPHHRVARGAAEACDCADDPDLVAEIDEKPPVMEETPDAPVYQQQPLRPAHFEELHGSALSADDAELADDQEATLGDGGLEPLLEAGDEAGAGRPARQTDFEEDPVQAAEEQTPEDAAHKVEDSEEQAPQAAEAVEGESQVEDVPETDASLPAPEGARAVEDAAEAPQGEPDALAAPVAPAAPAAPAAAAAIPDDVPAPQGAEGASA